MKILKLMTLVSALYAVNAFADTNEIKANLEKAFDLKVESIEKTNYGGLYEVVTQDTILYTDEKGSFVIAGSLIDTKTLEDVTEARMKKLTAIDFNSLPLDKALKRVHGNGERVLATFEDPNCGYCKRLYSEIDKLDNVTVYTFLIPILGKDSVKKTTNIWCAKDRNAAWSAWMKEHKTPTDAENCEEPTNEILALARKLQIRGTPMVLMANGERMNGYGSASAIEELLSKK
ncbi:DsbC family protein [Pelistega sp. MC2]|uniref:DsbC family protein n=1 Tax=Pelistega sp. MC2 TaxID=1720297 RepID=UPI0008DB0F82|nr:DsbC family protein [Pelistega sp. MC2]